MRWIFIDQLRGFAIIGMIIVNVLNEYPQSPYWLKHHTFGFTFADFIAPLFIFIVGYGYRLSFTKTRQNLSPFQTYKKFIKRYSILTLLGFIYGHFDFYCAVWDALTDIGISGLLLLPVIHCPKYVILLVGTIYVVIYQLIFSLTSYQDWVMQHSIDGGPLGPLSWVFIMSIGSYFACLQQEKRQISRHVLIHWFSLAVSLTLIGFTFTLPTIFDPIPFTQKGMTISYSVFSAGLCGIATTMGFIIHEQFKLTFKPLSTCGKNPLVIYFLQAILNELTLFILPSHLKSLYPTPIVVALGITLFCYIVAKYLETKSIYIKV